MGRMLDGSKGRAASGGPTGGPEPEGESLKYTK